MAYSHGAALILAVVRLNRHLVGTGVTILGLTERPDGYVEIEYEIPDGSVSKFLAPPLSSAH